MTGFVLLWQKILFLSLWTNESKETCLVWITLLLLKDGKGVVQSSIPGLAKTAKVSVEECRLALSKFLAPDPDDSSGFDDGRKLREVPGGWQIVNHDQYRYSTEARREFWRIRKAEQRRRNDERQMKREERVAAKGRGKTLRGEVASIRELNEGKITEAEFAERAATTRETTSSV